jgi:uncharacterized protein (TIGR02466 family)
MYLDLYFPTPVWFEQTLLDVDKIQKLVYNLKDQDPEGRKLSNQGGWQSKDFRSGTYTELKELEDKIMEQANNCVNDYGYDSNLCFVIIENMWFNINKKGDSNSVHIHDASFISGVFYIKARPGQGNITFYKSYNQDFIITSQAIIDRYTPLSASAMTFEPADGKLIMFPSYLPHGVERNNLDEDRISISFNVKLIRTDDERYRPAIIK